MLHEQGFDHWHWQARYLKGLFECQGLAPKAKSQKCKHGELLNAYASHAKAALAGEVNLQVCLTTWCKCQCLSRRN
jgi:hypothetical protein